MNIHNIGILQFIDEIVNHGEFKSETLKHNLFFSVEKLRIKSNIFIHDLCNDPKYIVFNTRMWILYNTSTYLRTLPPDINSIEHLWDYLRNIRKYQISLKNNLKNVPLEIPFCITVNLVNSIPRRIIAIVKSKGNP